MVHQMMNIQSATFATPDRKVVQVTIDDKTYFVNRQPHDGDAGNNALLALKRWVAQGNQIAPYVPPAPSPDPDKADLNAIHDQIRALAMVVANVTGTPMAEIRQKYRTAMNTILDQQG
jgi:hypothetical protein